MKSLRSKLFVWYFSSLVVLSIFFFLVVHILALQNGTYYFFALLGILAIIGFFIIRSLTRSLMYLASRIRHISLKNLDERITDVKSQDEIEDLAIAFNNLLDRLNDAFKREQRFIADVTHELKTPLATLRSSFEVGLSKERDKEEYKKILSDSLAETNHMSSVLKNVLDLAWSETPSEQKNMKKFDLSELTQEVFDIAQKLSYRKKITVDAQITQHLFIQGFRDKLARAILNIIENAVKYTDKQGKITIKLHRVHAKAVLTISDTGQGIIESEIPRIFDRFYRGSQTDSISGSGLGLAISKAVVALHRGYITVESEVGHGSTFTISLPLVSS